MIQTARGASSFDTSSSSEPAPVAPWPSASLTASSAKSKTTHSWSESRWMRWTMLPPILPSPMKPSCMSRSPSEVLDLLYQCGDRQHRVALHPHALGGQAVVAQGLQVAHR